MTRKPTLLPALLLLPVLLLASCVGLIPLEEDGPAAGEYGPQVSMQEHQTQTLAGFWRLFQENYIHYETAGLDWDSLQRRYQADVDSGLTAMEFEELLRGLENDLPTSSLIYQSREERIQTDTADNSTYEGIGAFVGFYPQPEPHIVLLSIIPGSPAERAGLQAHDSIYAIDGKPVLLEEGVGAVRRVRGPAGSTVALTVRSPGGPKREVQVQRGRLVQSVRLEVYRIAGTNYGYLLFPPVPYDSLLEDVLTSLRAFSEDERLDGLILDLRIAGSSGSWPLDSLSTVFFDGAVGEFYSRTDRQSLQAQGQDIFGSQDVPLVILVGANTRGFPEILAGGLQMHGRAVIVGEPTDGSVETSSAYLLADGSRVYIETASFVLPNGDEIGLNGVQPDVQIEEGWDEVQPGQDAALNAAIQQLRRTE